jgi:hypothetical protein
MHLQRFNRLAKIFDYRVSRRSALRSGGVGLGGLAFASSTSRAALAQEATPAATPIAASGMAEETLFVQSFANGAWAPKPGADGVYLLTLTGHPSETIYFSDRPQRIVGTLPTAQFFEVLGFTPENPPNAAVVAQTSEGEDVLVVELFNPTLSQASGADGAVEVTYEARVLAEYDSSGLASLSDRQGDGELPASFGPVSLFIDDCLDTTIRCMAAEFVQVNDFSPVGTCWTGGCCTPCEGDGQLSYWTTRCNEVYLQDCDGQCYAVDSNPFDCVS